MKNLTLILLFFFNNNSWAMLDFGGSSTRITSPCEIRLMYQEANKTLSEIDHRRIAAEFILMLSYDHPLFERWVERAKNLEELESIAHLVWGYALPIHVDPNLEIQKGRLRANLIGESLNLETYKAAFYAYLSGQFQFPIDQMRLAKESYDKYLYKRYQRNSENTISDLVEFYRMGADWEEWQKLSLEHRTQYVKAFLEVIGQLIKIDLVADPENDPRTGKQRESLVHISRRPFKVASYDYDSLVQTYVNRGAELDVFLPEEFYQFRILLRHIVNTDEHSSQLVQHYLINNMPLVLNRRAEAMAARKPFTMKKRNLLDRTDAKLYRTAWRFSFQKSDEAPAGSENGYLQRNYTLDEMKQSLRTQDGTLQVRIRHDMNLLVQSPDLLQTPPEMQAPQTQLALIESPNNYDMSRQLLIESPTQLINASINIKEKIVSLSNPADFPLENLSDIQRFGQELPTLLNQLSVNLSILDTSLDQTLTTFLSSKLSTGLTADSLQSLSTFITLYQAKKGHEYEQLLTLTEAVELFAKKVETYLKTVQTYEKQNKTNLSDVVLMALNRKIENLQNIYLLLRSQIELSIKVKSENHLHLDEATNKILLQIISLQTKKSLQVLDANDLLPLRDNLERLQTSIIQK